MRNKDTIDYLGLWESIYNPNFNRVGFEAVENEAGRNRFTMSPTKWINEGISPKDRLVKLNNIAIHQMTLLTEDNRIKKLENIADDKKLYLE